MFKTKYMLMNLLEEGGSGGGEATPPAAPAGEASPAGDQGIPFTPPEWAKGLTVDQEILKAPMFSSVKDMNDVVKGYYHAQKMVGADKIVVPTKNASADEWRNYYVKAGLPEKFDDYKVELPKSFDNGEFNSEFLKTAYEMNVKPDQLQKMTEMFEKFNDKIVQDYEASTQQELQKAVSTLKQEWGQGFDKQISRANRVIKHFGGEEMHKAVLGSDLSNNPSFIKLMAKIGEKMTGEDSFNYETTSSFGMTRDEAKSKINAIMGDSNSPYHNRDHAQHQELVDKVLKYHEILAQQ